MELKLPAEVKTIMSKMNNAGYEIYVVGGAVRDLLTGKIVTDWDYTTNATPESIQEVFPSSFYDNSFGTVGIPSQSDLHPHEITTFRTEHGYSDSRRPDEVKWGKSLIEDLKRRDFTINAIALSANKEITDPFNGQKDLKKKIVKAVGEPQERFGEDALRMMRAIRFASQLGFTIESNTLDAISTHATLINKVASERVRDELFKIFLSPYPDEGITLLRNTGLLEIILPEAEKMFGVDQRSPQRHHIYDVGTHALMSLKHCQSSDVITRFATFIHDIGKPQTYKKLDNGVITFYNHEIVSAKIASRIADRLRLSKAQKDNLWRLVRYHQFTVDEVQTDSAIRRFIKNVGVNNIDEMLELRRSDRLGSGARETSWRTEDFKARIAEVQKQPFTVHDLKLTGHNIMKELNLKPGPKIGEIMDELFKAVMAKEVKNTKPALLKKLKKSL